MSQLHTEAPRVAPGQISSILRSPHNLLDNRFVYTLISARARGLSVGVNMNPDKQCNFQCCYCAVNRSEPSSATTVDIGVMARELEATLNFIASGQIRTWPLYQSLPPDLLELRHVALSGDGEPTISPQFPEIVEAVVHLRARGKFPFYKVVLLTNAAALDRPSVTEGLRLFTSRDEIWAKLDAGTQAYFERVNKADVPLSKVLSNILAIAQHRPVVIQSLFPAIHGEGPAQTEIEAYADQLRQLKEAGAQIPLVQIYSAARPTVHSECGHLPLKTLSGIARRVREVSGLRTEVF